MYNITVHRRINQVISVYYFIGLWHDDSFTVRRKLASNVWFIGIYGLFIMSMVGGAFKCVDDDESVFLANASLMAFVVMIKSYCLLWKKDEILEFIQTFGTHSIRNSKDFDQVNKKVNNFVKFMCIFELFVVGTALAMIALPIFFNQKRLPLNVYIFFDWKENEVLYWMAYLITSYQTMLSLSLALFNFIIWYLMMSCAIKYQILGNEFRGMGIVDGVENSFLREIIGKIKYHRQLREYK